MSEETKDSKNKEAVKKTTKAAEPKAAKKTTKTKAAKKTTKPKVEKKATKPKAEKKASKAAIEPKVEKEIIESDITVSNEQSEELQNTESTKEDSKSEDSSKEDFLNDFDWNLFEEGIETIKDEKLSEFEKLVEENFVDTYNESVIEGTIISLTDREAIIDINAKSEGVISLNEFRYNPDLKVGDKVEVLVDIQEDKTGQLVLSHRKARTIKAWDRVNEAHDNSTVVTGFVKCRTKGGMIVDVFGLEAFLPGSQIDVKPIRDYDQYVNKNMEFKVVKINHEFKNVVVSHKALIEADIELQKKGNYWSIRKRSSS